MEECNLPPVAHFIMALLLLPAGKAADPCLASHCLSLEHLESVFTPGTILGPQFGLSLCLLSVFRPALRSPKPYGDNPRGC